jgi:hypothetical protein
MYLPFVLAPVALKLSWPESNSWDICHLQEEILDDIDCCWSCIHILVPLIPSCWWRAGMHPKPRWCCLIQAYQNKHVKSINHMRQRPQEQLLEPVSISISALLLKSLNTEIKEILNFSERWKTKVFVRFSKPHVNIFLFNQQQTSTPGPCGNYFSKVCAEVLKW